MSEVSVSTIVPPVPISADAADFRFGYCTNVHAGTSLAEAQANLLRYASAVRQQVVPSGRLPVGLWLSEPAAMSLIEQGEVHGFRDWLHENAFLPYTFNGFPQGDFHQAVVKHAVYEPTWTCDSRTRYTLCLAEILEAILPDGGLGSISTLPLGWPHAPWHAETMKTAADNLLEVAKFLDRLAQMHGREVVVAIEAEPGCVLNTAEELVEFFEHYLFSGPDRDLARRYLTVCHDICHSGVMFESQTEVLDRYRQAGMRVGKVQVSSAVHVPWDKCIGNPERQAALAEQLRSLAEPKYLHQTAEQSGAGGLKWLQADLPAAIQRYLSSESYPSQPWRVHFHVPIFVDQFGGLQTTQADIVEATRYLQQHQSESSAGCAWFTGHYEVETYAWPVLPPELAEENLAAGIARELQYFQSIHG
ncbi:MAG: metabolite traffic protein EboE [Planctomycetales bacterium]|nr:metabolite traffic protein EboE [Planctomycetales bacterium]